MLIRGFITILICFYFQTGFSQLSDLYENRRWDLNIQQSFFSTTSSAGGKQSFGFLAPIGLRYHLDQSKQGGNHFMWNPRLYWEGLALVYFGLLLPVNDFTKFNNYAITNGIIGEINWTKNIIGKDNFNLAAGIEFGDYVADDMGYGFGIGPSILIDKFIGKMAIGVNIWTSKMFFASGASSEAIKPWIIGVFPRILFSKGFYVEPGIITTDTKTSKYTRFEINIGKRVSFRK